MPKLHNHLLRWLILSIALLALMVSVTFARNDEFSSRAAFTHLQVHARGGLNAHWNDEMGIPDFIAGSDATIALPYTPNAIERGNPIAIARGFLDENRSLFKLTNVTEQLNVLRVESDAQLGYSHVRLNQFYHNIPVFGKQLVVHLDAQQNVVAVNGQFAPDVNVETQPSLTPDDAERVALQDLIEEQLTDAERVHVVIEILHDKTQLMVYVDEFEKAILTWNVAIMTDSPLGQWTYFVNARRPVVVHQFDSGERIKQRKTFTADNHAVIPGRIIIDEGERAKNDAVAQAAHDGAGKVYDYYFTTFKRDAIDGRGGPMVSTVHYGNDPEDAENAAWIGERQQMIYGDGGRIFKPLPYGLDIVGHEFTHGVTDGTAGLIYQGQSGALNESYSDVFAVLIDRANWTIGEQVVKSPPFPTPVLRSLEDPSLGGKYDPGDPLSGVGQPSKMSEFARLSNSRKADNGGVHINSGIPSRAAFLVAQALGREKMEQIYYRTLTQYLTPDSDFGDAARATLRAAQELYGANEMNAVRNAFAQVGIDASGTTQVPAPPTQPSQRPPNIPPPSQSLPTGCTNVIVNGTFENADAGWTQITTAHSSIIDTELPHTGARSAWLGGTDQEPVQYIYQEVRLPANATSVQLGYWRLIHYETRGLLGLFASEAKFSTNIANTNGDVIAKVEQFDSSVGDDQWHQGTANLSQLVGKAIRLVFGAENPKRNVSSYFIDDVELTVCTTGTAAPSAPQSSSAEQVYIQGYVKNADTGRGIEGAQFFVVKPGLSATDAAADDKVTTSEVLTYGVSDANGLFQTQGPILRGKTYSVIVLARGFRALVADDGMRVPANASNPFSTNADLRPSR